MDQSPSPKLVAVSWMVDLLLVWVGAGLLMILFGGFADYPCSVRYDEANHCYQVNHHGDDSHLPRTVMFLTTVEAGVNGGGCEAAVTAGDSIRVNKNGLQVLLQRVNDKLNVNGRMFIRGEEYRRVNWITPNPWTNYELRIQLAGVGEACPRLGTGIAPQPDRMFITGETGSVFVPFKGLTMLMLLIAFRIDIRRRMTPDKNVAAAQLAAS